MITGTLTENGKSKGFTANIHSLRFDLKGLNIVPNAYKTADNHPDFHVEYTTPRGRPLRIGAMWKAISQTTENTYYQLSITDKMGRAWRMNAVRNDEMAKGAWQIVPLAGGQTEQVMVNGQIELLDDGALVGTMGSYDFDMDFVGVPNPFKASDDHPDFHIEVKSPGGTPIRMGSVWQQTSAQNNVYLSISFYSPFGASHRVNGLRGTDTPEGKFDIVPMSPPRTAAA